MLNVVLLKCCYAQCRYAVLLNVTIQSVVILAPLINLSVTGLNGAMLSVDRLKVAALFSIWNQI